LKHELLRPWLRDLRIEKGYTMQELGTRVGVSGKYIGEIEFGRRNPSRKLALALSAELNFQAGRLFMDVLERQPRGSKEVKTAQ
jgi:transcriptional regulator with XRE-family HTH domain